MKTTTADADPQAVARLRELIEEVSVAMVITVTPDGTLRSRPMLTREMGDDGELWFFTSDDSDAAHDLAEEHAVNVSYSEPGEDRYVSVSGQASLVKDPEKMRQLWEPVFTRFFPRGLEEPHLALLRVRIESAEYWDNTSSKMIPLRQAAGPARHGCNDAEQVDERANNETRDGGGEHIKVDIRAVRASG